MVYNAVGYEVDLVSLHARLPERYPFLVESVATGTPRSRFDILFAYPGESLILAADGRLLRDGVVVEDNDFLAALDRWWVSCGAAPEDSNGWAPFTGGWFVYLGYELAGQVEPVVGVGEIEYPWPIAAAVRIPAAIVRDHAQNRACAIAEPGYEPLIDVLMTDAAAAKCPSRPPQCTGSGSTPGGAMAEEDPARFLEGVERIKRYIRDGDVFQVNLSRGWRGRLLANTGTETLYRRLRASNPAPFAGSARFGDMSILSSSPERLYSVRGPRVETRPIAGTHPRNADAERDRALSEAMLAHPKERAEHIMLIDLERNDLGRVCRAGSVEVNELMVLESYTHVHHIVSNVRGMLRAGTRPGEVIRAVFPGGTITGCPKVRCMEIIRELERVRRGPYTGAFGYLNRNGDADFNILIRTLVTHGRDVVLRAGAGIVADSVAERELNETRQKARGPLRALSGLVE